MALAAGVFESTGGYRPNEVQLVHGRLTTGELWTGQVPHRESGAVCNLQGDETLQLEVSEPELFPGHTEIFHSVVSGIVGRTLCFECPLRDQCAIGTKPEMNN